MAGLVLWLLSLAIVTSSSPAPQPRPLVLWHGLGDSHSSPGMLEFVELIKDVHPGIFVHSVYISEDLKEDQKASFYGNVDEQIDTAAEQLASIPELQDGFDGIGFSQGGQFLRAYVERYNDPPMHNLITFGSQHMGISDIPLCRPWDLLCKLARQAFKGGAYGEWAQENLVQAQYFRDPANLPTYLTSNHFLTSINNEYPPANISSRNTTYAQNLASLQNLVLVIFSEDRTVVPKESAWFGSEAPSEDSSASDSGQTPMMTISFTDKTIIPIRAHPIYTEDWIGLRALDKRGALVFEICKGEHMQIGDCWKELVKKFCGGFGVE